MHAKIPDLKWEDANKISFRNTDMTFLLVLQYVNRFVVKDSFHREKLCDNFGIRSLMRDH